MIFLTKPFSEDLPCNVLKILYEPLHENSNNLGFRPGPTQTSLCSYKRWVEAINFGFRNNSNCTICLAKTKALISCAVTAQLICAFVFAYANCWFYGAAAHIGIMNMSSQNARIEIYLLQKLYKIKFRLEVVFVFRSRMSFFILYKL